jgi:hypothetical protein
MTESLVPASALAPQRLLLVTGLLGAGKTTALKVLEDLGWEVIDNFPVRLLGRLIDSADAPASDMPHGAILKLPHFFLIAPEPSWSGATTKRATAIRWPRICLPPAGSPPSAN